MLKNLRKNFQKALIFSKGLNKNVLYGNSYHKFSLKFYDKRKRMKDYLSQDKLEMRMEYDAFQTNFLEEYY